MQLCERASNSWLNECKSTEAVELQEAPADVQVSIGSVIHQYPGATPSSAGVMERFLFSSSSNDPCPSHAQESLSATGVDAGSLENVNLRAGAARSIAQHVTPTKTESVIVNTSDASFET